MAINRNKLLTHAMLWKNLESMTRVAEARHKGTYCVIPCLGNVHTDRKQISGCPDPVRGPVGFPLMGMGMKASWD